MAQRKVAFTGAAVTPSAIKSITVLKDAAVTAIYGAMDANGGIVITKKKSPRENSAFGQEMQKIEDGMPYRQFYMKEYAGDDRETGRCGISMKPVTKP